MSTSRSLSLHSLFSQKLDRGVLVAYFLGAVVPLLALAFVVHRYALPALDGVPLARAAVVAVLLAGPCLTFASYLALRRLTHSALNRMDADNRRLSALLRSSRALTEAPHAHVVAERAAQCALVLTGAPAACVLRQKGSAEGADSGGESLSVYESVGDDAVALFERRMDAIEDLVLGAIRDGEPASVAWTSDAVSRAGLTAPNAGADSPTSAGTGGPTAVLVVPLAREHGPATAMAVFHDAPGAAFEPEELSAVATLAALAANALRTVDLQDLQRNFFTHVTDILVAALDAFVDGRLGHAETVARSANQVAREMGFDEQRLHRLHFAALLHDIGMLRIDRSKHRDPKHFMRHAKLGHRMVSRIRLWEDAAPTVLHHHEWYDGSGYPDGLARDAIPLEARIIAVSDAFDAMVRTEVGRPIRSTAEALAELRQGAGTQFDPEVVTVFARLVDEGQIGSPT